MVHCISDCWRVVVRFDIHGGRCFGFAVERSSVVAFARLDVDDVAAFHLVLYRARSAWWIGDRAFVLPSGNANGNGPANGHRASHSRLATDTRLGADRGNDDFYRFCGRQNFSSWNFVARQNSKTLRDLAVGDDRTVVRFPVVRFLLVRKLKEVRKGCAWLVDLR